MLKEMPDMMPTPIEKKEHNLYDIFIRILLKIIFHEIPENRGEKPLVEWELIPFAVIYWRKQNWAKIQ